MFNLRALIFIFAIVALPKWSHAKIYDCFLFFNEVELLDMRLHELYDHVDKFVLVESTETFRGNPKSLTYQENSERFAPFADKIIHVVVDEHIETNNPWIREAFQRDQIMRGLKECTEEDIIFVSDVDEIVRASAIPRILETLKEHPNIGCGHTMYRYYFNCLEDTHWKGTCVTTFGYLSSISPEALRKSREINKTLYNTGWHFTSMGGLLAYIKKLESFSHYEYDSEYYKKQEIIEKHVNDHCQIVPIDNSYPSYLLKNLDRYEELGYFYKSSDAITPNFRKTIRKYGYTDKDDLHSYIEPYERLLSSFTDKPCNLLEIGVKDGGSSIMWHEHLLKSRLFLMDIHNVMQPHITSSMDPNRWHLYVADAYTLDMVKMMQQECPTGFDIIIDDGPHSLESQIFALNFYLPLLNHGGVLVIEDVQQIEHVEILKKFVPTCSEFQIEVIDLRAFKSRWDDILFVVKRSDSSSS